MDTHPDFQAEDSTSKLNVNIILITCLLYGLCHMPIWRLEPFSFFCANKERLYQNTITNVINYHSYI